MKTRLIKTQLEKLFNRVLVSKYPEYLEQVDIYDMRFYSLNPEKDEVNTFKIKLTVTPHAANEFYGIWKRIKKTDASYEKFLKFDTLSHLFIDDVFDSDDFFDEANSLAQYVVPGGFLTHPMKIEFPEKLD